MRHFRTGLSLVLVMYFVCPSPGFSAGFSIFEQGAKATGMGGAFAATADDPSAIFYNVAGIAHQRKTAALIGADLITFGTEFNGDPLSEYPGGGVRESSRAHTFVIPNAYLVVPIGENVTFGVGQFAAFGIRSEWDDASRFSGRFIAQDANLKTVSVQPSLAMKMMDDRLAIGVGVEYRTSKVELERNNAAINPFTQRIVDVAHVRLDSEYASSYGFNLGVLLSLSDHCRVGLSYRSPIDIDYKGDANFTQISTGNAQFDSLVASGLPPRQDYEASIAFPGFIHLGGATSFREWEIEADVVRMDWSRFEALDITFDRTPAANLHIPENYEDVYSFRIGGNRAATDRWDIRLGAYYDQTPQPLEVADPLLPDADRVAVTFGVGFQGEHWSVDASEMVLHFLDRNTEGRNRDNFNGEYQTTANLFSVNIGYRF